MEFTKGERKHTQPDANGGVNVFTNEKHIAYFDSLDDALLDIAAPVMYEALGIGLKLADAIVWDIERQIGKTPRVEVLMARATIAEALAKATEEIGEIKDGSKAR